MLLKLAMCARRFGLRALSRWFVNVERELKFPEVARERRQRRSQPFTFVTFGRPLENEMAVYSPHDDRLGG